MRRRVAPRRAFRVQVEHRCIALDQRGVVHAEAGCVVDQRVDAAEPHEAQLDHPLHVRRVGQFGMDDVHGRGVLRDYVVGRERVDVPLVLGGTAGRGSPQNSKDLVDWGVPLTERRPSRPQAPVAGRYRYMTVGINLASRRPTTPRTARRRPAQAGAATSPGRSRVARPSSVSVQEGVVLTSMTSEFRTGRPRAPSPRAPASSFGSRHLFTTITLGPHGFTVSAWPRPRASSHTPTTVPGAAVGGQGHHPVEPEPSCPQPQGLDVEPPMVQVVLGPPQRQPGSSSFRPTLM